jgi:hypothetical protein
VQVAHPIRANPVRGQKTAPLLGQVLTLLKADLAANDDLLAFNVTPLPIINCANGELWLTADGGVELRAHRPESYLRHCLDVAFDPGARCPEYDRALRGIFGAAKKPEAHTVMQLLGSPLVHAQRVEDLDKSRRGP